MQKSFASESIDPMDSIYHCQSHISHIRIVGRKSSPLENLEPKETTKPPMERRLKYDFEWVADSFVILIELPVCGLLCACFLFFFCGANRRQSATKSRKKYIQNINNKLANNKITVETARQIRLANFPRTLALRRNHKCVCVIAKINYCLGYSEHRIINTTQPYKNIYY